MFSNEGDVKAAFTPQSMKLEKTLSLEEVNHIFLDFYANYILKKNKKTSQEDIHSFLNSINLLQLSKGHIDLTDAPITDRTLYCPQTHAQQQSTRI